MIKIIKFRGLISDHRIRLHQINTIIKCLFTSLHKKPFQILGVQRNASLKQIKTAYYKLAKQYHPDINKQSQTAHSMFSEINKAYQNMINNISSNQQYSQKQNQWNQRYAQEYQQEFVHHKKKRNNNRRHYENQFSENEEDISQEDFAKFEKAFQSFIRKGKIDPKYKTYEKFFVNFFTNRNSKNFSQQRQYQQVQYENQYGYHTTHKDIKFTTIEEKLDITKEEAENGGTKSIMYKKIIICQTCNGNVRTRKQVCRKCGGTGWIGKRADTIVSCNSCYGNGEVKIHGCKNCKGRGSIQKQTQQPVTIPKGTINNQTIILKGRGHQHPTKFFFGDLIIKIKINNKPFVTKNGHDTQQTLSMSVSDAVLGNYMKYHTYYGEKMGNIQAGQEDGDIIKLKGEGLRKGNGFGNHFLKIKIQIPKKLSKEQQKLYEQLRQLQKLSKRSYLNEEKDATTDKKQFKSQFEAKSEQQQQMVQDDFDDQQQQFIRNKNSKPQRRNLKQERKIKNRSEKFE